jgi:hypothetical protein
VWLVGTHGQENPSPNAQNGIQLWRLSSHFVGGNGWTDSSNMKIYQWVIDIVISIVSCQTATLIRAVVCPGVPRSRNILEGRMPKWANIALTT